MSLLTKKGTFVAPTSAGSSQVVSNLGFTPKAVLLWATKQTATGFAAGRAFSFGWTDGTNQRVITSLGNDAATTATNVSGRSARADKILLLLNYAAGAVTFDISAAFVSLDSSNNGGFTINMLNAGAGKNVIVHYLALGGDDLTNAYAGTILSPASTTGPQGYSGFGFQPDFLMVATLGATAVGDSTGGRIQIGAASSSTQRASMLFDDNDSIPTTTAREQISTQILDWRSNTGTALLTGDLDSFDTDGVTIDWSVVQATQRVVFVLALKGGQYWVGTDTQKTSTGTQTKSGVGFQPAALMLMGLNEAASTSWIDTTRSAMSLGASDGTNEGCVWGSSTDNVSTTDENSATVDDKILIHATNSATTDAAADLSEFGTDGYTLDWTTVNEATAREFIAVAMGSELGVTLDTCLPDADVTTTGWSTAPLYSKINDSSDATVITATAS